MATQPRVAILSFSPLAIDMRVLRQARSLTPAHRVDIIGYGAPDARAVPELRFHSLPEPGGTLRRNLTAIPKLVLGRVAPRSGYDRWYWDRADHRVAFERLVAVWPDVIVANDWDALPAAARAAEQTGARIVLDLHEYSPRQHDNRQAWMALIAPMIVFTLRRYGSRVSQFITVNQSIAARYERELGFRCAVVMNIPELSALAQPHPTDPARIRLVHHGAPIRERRLETMIDAVARADARYELTFMLLDSDRRYLAELRARSERVAHGRVHFEPTVPPDRIVPTLARFDVGFYVLPPSTTNTELALPNKFFDFISAGLAVCIGPTTEMARLVREHCVGVVADTFEPGDVARLLTNLTAPEIDRMKHAATRARAVLNAETEMAKVRAVVREALQG